MRWLLAITLCACGSKDSPPPPAPAPVEVRPPQSVGAGDQLPQPIVDLPKQESFRVLDPGHGERETLRYSVGLGEVSTRIEMTLSQRKLNGTAWTDPTKLPPIRTGLAIAAADGTKVRARALPGEISGTPTPEATDYLTAWKASEGRRLTIGLDARGQLGPITFADDPTSAHSRDAIDDMTQRLLVVVVPVPEEPIATGARWQVVTVLAQRPVVVKQTATYTLMAHGSAGWEVQVELRRVGEQQTISADTELVALDRTYKGTLKIAPGAVLPTGALDVDSSMHLRLGPKTDPIGEQILADQGTVVLSTP